MIIFEGNCSTGITRQGKYTVKLHNGHHVVSVMIETADGMRMYPATRDHETLVAMVNAIKEEATGIKGGAFYINEHGQVIVPAGNPVKYYYAGEYHERIRLRMEDAGEEFSGRPHDAQENLLSPGQPWDGRPRPGIQYTLAAGGQDIHYKREISPQRELMVKLSKVVGIEAARQTASKIARVKGNKGGAFYVNEYRALFCPVTEQDFVNYRFIGVLTEQDPWFPKWEPPVGGAGGALGRSPAASPAPMKPVLDGDLIVGENPTAKVAETPVAYPAKLEPLEQRDDKDENDDEEIILPTFQLPLPRRIEIDEDEKGHTYFSLFVAYLRGATQVTLEDPYMRDHHQVANFLRFCELLIRVGTVRQIKLLTGEVSDESYAKLETMKRSLAENHVSLEISKDDHLHDRRITTDTGWEINLGRGLDIYKHPGNWMSVGASDFALRPCHKHIIVYHRFNQ